MGPPWPESGARWRPSIIEMTCARPSHNNNPRAIRPNPAFTKGAAWIRVENHVTLSTHPKGPETYAHINGRDDVNGWAP